MIRDFGRWVFSRPALRRTALVVLYPLPGVRRALRVFIGVEGGPAGTYQRADCMPPRVASIYEDLANGTRKSKGDR